jgi:ABC-type Mn2+/Zn2+ transport system permease subunit
MRGRFPRVGDRAVGITLGIVLGIGVILVFLFLGSRSTIDEPSISGGSSQTVTQPTASPGQPKPKAPQ